MEHNTTDPSTTTPNNSTTPDQHHRRRRPDLSTFFSALSEITPDEARHRPHAVPVPRDVSAAFYSLAEALDLMRREGGGGAALPSETQGTAGGDGDNDLLTTMIQSLLSTAEMPPREVEGASEEFCDRALNTAPKHTSQSKCSGFLLTVVWCRTRPHPPYRVELLPGLSDLQ